MSKQRDGDDWLQEAVALVDRANSDPLGVIDEATALLNEIDDEADHRTQSVLQRAIGLALRIDRRPREAMPFLLESVRLADISGDRQLTGQALLSLALAESYLGETATALTTIGRSLDALRGLDRADARFQRGLILQLQGEYAAALDDYRAALPVFRNAGRDDWVADLLANRGIVHAYRGAAHRSLRDFAVARELFAKVGDDLGAASMAHNTAWVTGLTGDVAEALAGYEAADELLVAADFPVETVAADRGEALLSAGLFTEAIELAARSTRALQARGMELEEAESLVILTEACAHAGRHRDAAQAANRAVELLTRHNKHVWLLRARLAALRARGADATPPEATSLADAFDQAGLANSAAAARIVAADLHIRRGNHDEASALLELMAPARLAPENAIAWWQTEAERRRAAGQLATASRAAEAGRRAVRRRQIRANTSEVRAHLGHNMQRLADVGLAHAVDTGDPTRFASWVDELGWVPPPTDRAADGSDTTLFELRAVAHEMTHVAPDDANRTRLAARHRRLSRSLRARREGRATDGGGLTDRADLGALQVCVVGRSGGRVWSAITHEGRSHLRQLGPADELEAAVRRLALVVRSSMSHELTDRQRQQLDREANTVDELLGCPGEGRSGTMTLLLDPAYDACPTGFLPSLRDRAVLHATTLRSTAQARSSRKVTISVAGPRLDHSAEEAGVIARLHGGRALVGADATAAATREAFERADIVHVAAHARRSLDSAYFDCLEMADGPLFLHELQTLDRAPDTVVLAACEAGHSDSTDEAQRFGLVAALDGVGVRRTIASPFPVPDDGSTIDAMAALHRCLRAEPSAEEALSAAQADEGLSGRARSILLAFRCAGRPSPVS